MGNGQSTATSTEAQLLNQREALAQIQDDMKPAIIEACDGIPIDELNALLESQKNDDGKIVLRRFMHRDIFTTYTSNHKVPRSIKFRESYLVHRDDDLYEDSIDPMVPTTSPIPCASSAIHTKRISCDTFGSMASESEISERDYSAPSSNQSSPRVRFRSYVEYCYPPTTAAFPTYVTAAEKYNNDYMNFKPETKTTLLPGFVPKAATAGPLTKNNCETRNIIPEATKEDGLKTGPSPDHDEFVSSTNSTNSGSPKKIYNRLLPRIKSQKHKASLTEDVNQTEGLSLCIDSPVDTDDNAGATSTTTSTTASLPTTTAAAIDTSRPSHEGRRLTMRDMEEFDFSANSEKKDGLNFDDTAKPILHNKASFDRYASHQANPRQVNKVTVMSKQGRYIATKGSINRQSLPPMGGSSHKRTDSIHSDGSGSSSSINAGIPPRVPKHDIIPTKSQHNYSVSESEISVSSVASNAVSDSSIAHGSPYTRKCSYRRPHGISASLKNKQAAASKTTTTTTIAATAITEEEKGSGLEDDAINEEAIKELNNKAFMLSGYKPSQTRLYVTNPDDRKSSAGSSSSTTMDDKPGSTTVSSSIASSSSPVVPIGNESLLDLYFRESEDIWSNRAQLFAAKVKI